MTLFADELDRMSGPDVDFWQAKFIAGQVPWDRGAPSPQLQHWLDGGQLSLAGLTGPVAVPGCGAGHEVARLAAHGFAVIAIDYAPAAIALTSERLLAARLHASLVHADVLSWRPALPIAAVYEQTCLCALHPDQWAMYAGQLHAWLQPGGQLFALFMQLHRDSARRGQIEGPPYHCDINAMRSLFPDASMALAEAAVPATPTPNGRRGTGSHSDANLKQASSTGTAVVFLTRSSTKLVLQSCTLGCLSSVSMMKRE